MLLKMSSEKCRPFCLDLSVSINFTYDNDEGRTLSNWELKDARNIKYPTLPPNPAALSNMH